MPWSSKYRGSVLTPCLWLLGASFLFSASASAAPVRGLAGDLWADKILGQDDFSQTHVNETVANALFHPNSVVTDNAHNILYVWDSGNNRVLGISNFSSAGAGQGADIVLGQADFNHSGSNHDSNWQTFDLSVLPNAFYSPPILPTANTLMSQCYSAQSTAEAGSQANMAVDSQGNLYVPDYENNRVLRYDYPLYVNEPASHVWGQLDSSSIQRFDFLAANNDGTNNSGVPNNKNLNFFPTNQRQGTNGSLPEYGAGVAIDPWGNLWVADPQNNRVLRFPNPNAPSPGIPSTTADVVLGQNSFTANGVNGASNYNNLSVFPILREPQAVRVDAVGNVYVVECSGYAGYGRVSIFKPTGSSAGMPTYTIGQTASGKIQEPGGTSVGTGEPMGIEIDPSVNSASQVGLWVVDHFNFTTYHYLVNPSTLARTTPLSFATAEYMSSPGVDNSGKVYIANYRGDQVDRFPSGGTSPDISLFTSYGYDLGNKPGPVGMRAPTGVIVAVSSGGATQIVATDSYRLHFWNMPPGGPSGLTNGAPEDGYAGTNTPYVFNGAFRAGYGQMAQDPTADYLWVIDSLGTGNRAAAFALPLSSTPQVSPDLTVTSPLPVLGQATLVSFTSLTGLAMDAAGNLWLSDYSKNRVMRVRNPRTSPVIDIILGQPNAVSTASGLSSTTLSYPGFLKLDHQGDLFVSDDWLEFIGNNRMLRFDAKSIPANPASCVFAIPADGVYGTGGSLTSPGGTPYDSAFWEAAFNSDDSFMVAGTNSQLFSGYPAVILQNPRNGIMPSGTGDAPGAGDNVAGHLNDYGPQTFAVNFDKDDNLYAVDLNRNRVLIYYKPLGNYTPTPTPTGTLPPTPTNTSTWTRTFTPTFTWTDSFTPTDSPTPIPTNTPTGTLTPSATPTATPPCCNGVGSLAGVGGFSSPSGMAIHYGKGLIYITDLGHHQIQVFTTAGAAVTVFGSSQLVGPDDVAVDDFGNIFVGDYTAGLVARFNPDYSFGGNIGLGIVSNVRGVCVENQGSAVKLYVASQNGFLYRFDSVNGTTYSAGLTFGGGLSAPTGIVKVGNKIYVPNTSGGNVIRYDVNLGYSAAATYSAFGGPYGIKTDLAGYFYLTGPTGLQVLNPDFTLNHTCAIPNFAWSCVVDSQGRDFVSEYSGNAVTIVQGCFAEPTITPTPMPTNTPTVTNSPTSTYTITDTPTNSPVVNSPTPTATASPSSTPTSTPTGTPTDSPTSTPTTTPVTSPTNTPTDTPTSTATVTPVWTPGNTSIFPNPADGTVPVRISNLKLTVTLDVKVRVFTTVCRKVNEVNFPQVNPGDDLTLPLTDQWGTPLSNGLYYVVVTAGTRQMILKFLVLR